MTQIVKGLRFHYTTQQLNDHMVARAAHHDQRAEQKASALPELRKAVDTVRSAAEATTVAQMSKFTNSYHFDAGDQVSQLETDIKEHRNKALVFRALAQHLVSNATYDLDENDLRRLEIVK